MNLNELLTPERTFYCSDVCSKKRLFEQLAEIFAGDNGNISTGEIFHAYINREKLGPTALGHGVAIPHIRSELITKPMAALLQLSNPIDFGAEDHQAVDIIFALVVPSSAPEQHLEILAELVSLLKQSSFREALRTARDDRLLYQNALTYEQ